MAWNSQYDQPEHLRVHFSAFFYPRCFPGMFAFTTCAMPFGTAQVLGCPVAGPV